MKNIFRELKELVNYYRSGEYDRVMEEYFNECAEA